VIDSSELVERCRWVLRREERILRAEGKIAPDYYFGKGSGSLLYQIRLNRLAPWMNSGPLKEFLFSLMRHNAEDAGYDCVIFASDVWSLTANTNIPVKDLRGLTLDKAAHLGYGKKVEAVMVNGQTPELAAFLTLPYYRDALNPDKVFRTGPEEQPSVGPLNNMSGRLKMFGDWREPGMKEAYEKVREFIPEFKKQGIDLPSVTKLVNIAAEEP